MRKILLFSLFAVLVASCTGSSENPAVTRAKQLIAKMTLEEKAGLCRVAVRVKPDFVKTSTGFGTGGATVEDVRLMRTLVGPEMGVKAAGGIRTLEDALSMIEAGATRIGTSAGEKILAGLKK